MHNQRILYIHWFQVVFTLSEYGYERILYLSESILLSAIALFLMACVRHVIREQQLKDSRGLMRLDCNYATMQLCNYAISS